MKAHRGARWDGDRWLNVELRWVIWSPARAVFDCAGWRIASTMSPSSLIVSSDRPVALSVLSRMPVAQLAAKDAPTWLDRELANGSGSAVRDAGFGREVRSALAARRQWLVDQQLADCDGQAFRCNQALFDTLRLRELEEAGGRLGRELGKALESAWIGRVPSRSGWTSKAALMRAQGIGWLFGRARSGPVIS